MQRRYAYPSREQPDLIILALESEAAVRSLDHNSISWLKRRQGIGKGADDQSFRYF
jgi:hypothetical protein